MQLPTYNFDVLKHMYLVLQLYFRIDKNSIRVTESICDLFLRPQKKQSLMPSIKALDYSILYPTTSFTSRLLRDVNVQTNNSRKRKAKEVPFLFCVCLFAQSHSKWSCLVCLANHKAETQIMRPVCEAGYWIDYNLLSVSVCNLKALNFKPLEK